jgi:hypothetical protein
MQFIEEEAAEIVAALQARACLYAKIENQYRGGYDWQNLGGRAACIAKADEFRAKRKAVEALINRLEYVGCMS